MQIGSCNHFVLTTPPPHQSAALTCFRVSFYFAFFLVCNSFVFKLRILTLSFLFVLSRFTSYCTVYRTRCHQQQRMMADQVATDFTIHHPSRRLCNTSKHIPQSQRSSKVGRSLFYVTHNN